MNVKLPTMLESYAGGRRDVTAHGATVAELLIDLNNSYPGIRFRMVNEQDRLRPHMRIFINNVAIRSLDVELDDSDEIFILQSLSGG